MNTCRSEDELPNQYDDLQSAWLGFGNKISADNQVMGKNCSTDQNTTSNEAMLIFEN